MSAKPMNWAAVHRDPRFQQLHRRKSTFLWGLMLFSIVYYFLLPIGAGWFQELFSRRVWGPINVGLVFALPEFVVAWGIAWWYAQRANTQFDALAAEINRDAMRTGGGP